MNGLPEGAVLFGGRQCVTRVVETVKYGNVALVEMTEYAQGEAMGAISKRLGVRCVLLVADGELNSFTAQEVEETLELLLAEVNG
jgi:hypothetical protein